MHRMRVLVVSAGSRLGAFLERRLSIEAFDVRTATPGAGLVEAVRAERSDLAVLDGIDAHRETAPLVVALLKDRNPDVRIIALSDASSELDGAVIEQGVSCYLANSSREELLRVIEAVAREPGPSSRRPPVSQPRSVP